MIFGQESSDVLQFKKPPDKPSQAKVQICPLQSTTETHEAEKDKEVGDVPLRNFTRVEAKLLTPSNLDLEGSVNNLKKVMLGESIKNLHQSYPDKLLD